MSGIKSVANLMGFAEKNADQPVEVAKAVRKGVEQGIDALTPLANQVIQHTSKVAEAVTETVEKSKDTSFVARETAKKEVKTDSKFLSI